jgi:GntR family transcriptional regulator of arabinose operon
MNHKVDPNNPLPLYYQVYQSILERIQGGEFSEGDLLPPERRLVEEYGASRITIVKALDMLENDGLIDRQHGRGTFVTFSRAAESSSAMQAHGTIGMMVPSLSHPYLISIMTGIAREANRAGYALQVISSFENPADERKQLESLAERALDGVIVYPRLTEASLGLYRALAARKPLVMVDRYVAGLATDRILFQDELAGFELTGLLVKKGHRRIAWISHEAPATSVQNRLIGHRRALAAHGLALDEDLMWLDLFPRQKRVSETPLMSPELRDRLFERITATGPTALLAANYDIALRLASCVLNGNLEYLQNSDRPENGVRRPVEIAAFSYETQLAVPPYCLTHAYQSGEEMGTQAAQLLFGRIQNPNVAARTVEIPMQLSDPACGEQQAFVIMTEQA